MHFFSVSLEMAENNAEKFEQLKKEVGAILLSASQQGLCLSDLERDYQ